MGVPTQGRGLWRGWREAAVALALAAALWPGVVQAQSPSQPQSQAQSRAKSAVLVVDANTGKVLHQSAADQPRYPASLTKMMTIYLAFELIEQGRLSYQTRIKISANAAAAAPSKLDLDAGEEIALIDAIKVLITKSANDVAIAVAEHIAGSEEAFAALMTRKARQLGMGATTFKNASGLPDDGQVTTARDMITLALRLQDDFAKHYHLFGTRTFTYKDDTFRNHNTLLFHYPGTDGLKTGYTRASGFNLAASVRRGDKHVIGVVFGGATAATRNAAMRTYLNAALVRASDQKTRRPAPPLVARAAPLPMPSRAMATAGVPTPQRVDRSAVTRAMAAVEAAGRPTGPSAAAAAAPPPPAAAPAPTPIQIARVRSVLVAPATVAHPTADEPPANAEPELTIEALLQRHRAPDEEDADRPAPRAPTWVSASMDSARAVQPAPDDRPAFLGEHSIVRGAPPSTFEQQVANLARGEAAVTGPRPPLRAAQPEPALRPSYQSASAPPAQLGGYQIQIGAYGSEAEAQRQLAFARGRLPSVLGDRTPLAIESRQGGTRVYRARYGGFAAQAAAAGACTELKRLKIDCLVAKPE